MEYNDVISYINSIERFGSRPGLVRVQNLLRRLGNPEKNLKVIHVAGTNGKGSVSTMISYILEKSGYDVGMYTSPHLENYNERIKINNKDISDEEFATAGEKIIKACQKCVENNEEHPTVFEFLTAMALLYFDEQSVDFVVLEVGLGGRYDATNVIENPLLSVITSISMDHMDVLGDSIESIAFEKAGIIKKNCSTVLFFPNNKVYNIIKSVCESLNSQLYYVSDMHIQNVRHSIEGITFSINTDFYSYKDLKVSLIGEHQIYNTALVLLAVEVLRNKGIEISEENVRIGLEECYWPGRLEIVGKNPLVLLDGAHNEEGALALAKAFEQYFHDQNITLLIGVLKDKPYELMLKQLLPYASKVVLTEPNSSRKLPIDELEKTAVKYSSYIYQNADIAQAYELALKLTNEKDVLCCAGSLYLIGEIKKMIKKRS
ncbi:bifunctional folylpolyglutamate synthase/dihydrofolate synthase [Defluviitalea raffinosedens]|uniref:Dihydrofolate synthase/folylpolyglutamate synthase n=1 Tax=Defluviitalea raffinosedens TaxID=1450156 RepID=A0A7C8LK92_9FIRM|nr:folylpolyglutamate synthase/dihydrofolate synthase family protein [Defluviitalea raffinosedens]KAE9633424.1 bifunctional folylpolyglutamate synthase/dihydrofolate synthase [Defluviitalea raffinosedens]HHW68235.1 bifunctional folylpolyglutamate synthase/dihydrofolate synthase [Candidatus Epulonipiscium sp.]